LFKGRTWSDPAKTCNGRKMTKKMRGLGLLLLLGWLSGCYAGSVKPMLNRPEFQKENLPIRTLRVSS